MATSHQEPPGDQIPKRSEKQQLPAASPAGFLHQIPQGRTLGAAATAGTTSGDQHPIPELPITIPRAFSSSRAKEQPGLTPRWILWNRNPKHSCWALRKATSINDIINCSTSSAWICIPRKHFPTLNQSTTKTVLRMLWGIQERKKLGKISVRKKPRAPGTVQEGELCKLRLF